MVILHVVTERPFRLILAYGDSVLFERLDLDARRPVRNGRAPPYKTRRPRSARDNGRSRIASAYARAPPALETVPTATAGAARPQGA